jgi:hypothetical protein
VSMGSELLKMVRRSHERQRSKQEIGMCKRQVGE